MAVSGEFLSNGNGLQGILPGRLVFYAPDPQEEIALSEAAARLLLTILQNAKFDVDQQQNILLLSAELGIALPDKHRDRTTAILGVAVLGEMVLGG